MFSLMCGAMSHTTLYRSENMGEASISVTDTHAVRPIFPLNPAISATKMAPPKLPVPLGDNGGNRNWKCVGSVTSLWCVTGAVVWMIEADMKVTPRSMGNKAIRQRLKWIKSG